MVSMTANETLLVESDATNTTGEKCAVNAFGQAFRDYSVTDTERIATVENTYQRNHEFQTLEFVNKQEEYWIKFDKMRMGIWEAAELLCELVDESDPDLDLPQIVHLLQTGEGCKQAHPDQDWLHLTGFIHDLGKIMGHEKFGALPQWAVVGDTFPVGCAFDPDIVFSTHFDLNPDSKDPRYNTQLGIYQKNCGLDNVHMSWGHDEYMYQVMKHNGCSLPPAAFFCVRYHSFYALHTAGKYDYLLNQDDRDNLYWLKEFNKCDLYTKSYNKVDLEELKTYYQGLIAKYFPKDLAW